MSMPFLLQTLPEVRGRSLKRVQGSCLLTRDLAKRAICDGERAPRRSGLKYPAGDNTLRGGLLCPPMGLMEGVNTMSGATSRICRKKQGWRTDTRHSPEG